MRFMIEENNRFEDHHTVRLINRPSLIYGQLQQPVIMRQ